MHEQPKGQRSAGRSGLALDKRLKSCSFEFSFIFIKYSKERIQLGLSSTSWNNRSEKDGDSRLYGPTRRPKSVSWRSQVRQDYDSLPAAHVYCVTRVKSRSHTYYAGSRPLEYAVARVQPRCRPALVAAAAPGPRVGPRGVLDRSCQRQRARPRRPARSAAALSCDHQATSYWEEFMSISWVCSCPKPPASLPPS